MAGAADLHLTSADIQDTSDSSDKEGLWIVTGDLLIQRRDQDIQGHMLAQGQAFAECLAQRHEQRRRDAFPGDVAYDKEKVILVQHKGVVEIPTDLFGWFEECMECQVFRQTCNGPGGRQHAHLDIACSLEFSLHPATGEPFKLQGSSKFAPAAITGSKSSGQKYDQYHSIPGAGKRRIKEKLPSAEGDKTTRADQEDARQAESHTNHGSHTWQYDNKQQRRDQEGEQLQPGCQRRSHKPAVTEDIFQRLRMDFHPVHT